jgi:hypothetical protein
VEFIGISHVFSGIKYELFRSVKATQRQQLDRLLQLGEELRESLVGYAASSESESNQERTHVVL